MGYMHIAMCILLAPCASHVQPSSFGRSSVRLRHGPNLLRWLVILVPYCFLPAFSMPWVNATGLRRPRTVLEHVTRTTKFHADGTSSVRDSTSTAAEVAAVHAEAAKDSEDVPNVSVRTGWVRLTGGVARVDVAATYGQAFADTVQRITTRNEEAGKDRWLAIRLACTRMWFDFFLQWARALSTISHS